MVPPGWRVEITRQAQKDIAALPVEMEGRVEEAIAELKKAPMFNDMEKLSGREQRYKIRVGDWRIILRVDKPAKVVFATSVKPRGSAYKP